MQRRVIRTVSRYCIRYNSSTSIVQSSILKQPTYDVKEIVQNLDAVIDTSRKRELPQPTIEKISSLKELYDDYKKSALLLNDMLKEKNAIQREIKQHLKNNEGIDALKAKQQSNKLAEKEVSTQFKLHEKDLNDTLDLVPNNLEPDVTSEEQIIKFLNPLDEYKPNKDLIHNKIGVDLGIIDLKTASVVSGTSWYYLLGDGALLEQALVQYSLSLARKHGFIMAVPPSIVRTEVANACGFKPRDQNNEEQIYQLGNSNHCLTGTAEIPLAGLGINKVFKQDELPYRVAGISRSYRAEAGARGKDTKGLYRVHEFTKVELFVWSTDKQSSTELERLRGFQETLIESLGLSAKVINMPYNDLGAPAVKKYDIEAWMPGREGFGEVTSASNCTDYQSRRLNTKFKSNDDGKNYFVHTLNGTAMAVPRVIVAIIENFYDPTTKRISIPKVLQRYMDDKEFIVG